MIRIGFLSKETFEQRPKRGERAPKIKFKKIACHIGLVENAMSPRLETGGDLCVYIKVSKIETEQMVMSESQWWVQTMVRI
jgi:hypothetical protein